MSSQFFFPSVLGNDVTTLAIKSFNTLLNKNPQLNVHIVLFNEIDQQSKNITHSFFELSQVKNCIVFINLGVLFEDYSLVTKVKKLAISNNLQVIAVVETFTNLYKWFGVEPEIKKFIQ